MSATALRRGRDEAAISLEQWAALPEDESAELVDGRLEEVEVPELIHEVLVAFLVHRLLGWVRPLGGLVVASGAKLAVTPARGRMPDVAVFFPGRPFPAPRGLVRVPPDIAIEIVSPTPLDARRDRVEKVGDYAGFGVRWYWIVDPELRSLEILELGDDGRYVHALGATGGILDPVPGCVGLSLDVDELWAEIDRLGGL